MEMDVMTMCIWPADTAPIPNQQSFMLLKYAADRYIHLPNLQQFCVGSFLE